MKKLSAILLFVIMALLAGPVIAATSYYANVYVTESGSTTYEMLPVIVPMNITTLVNKYYITSSGLDTRLKRGGVDQPHMLTNDRLLFSIPLPESATRVPAFSTSNTPLDYFTFMAGWGGYITIPDEPTMEPGNDFKLAIDGYIHTAAGDNKRIIYKDQAVDLSVTAENEVTGTVYTSAPVSETSYVTGDDVNTNINGTVAEAQTFTVGGSDITLTAVELLLGKVGSPAGYLTVSIRPTSAGSPAGSGDLVTFVVANADIAAGPAWYEFSFTNKIPLTAATVYALVAKNSAGDGGNYVTWRCDSTSATYADGSRYFSNDNGSTWNIASNQDLLFDVYKPGTAVVVSYNDETNLACGEHIIVLDVSGGDLRLLTDGEIRDTEALGGSVFDSDYSWQAMANNSVVYFDSLGIYHGASTLQAQYQPVTVIQDDTLPDEENDNDATITWGSNPEDVAAFAGELIPSAKAQATGYPSGETVGVMTDAPTEPGGWTSEGTGSNLPGGDVINAILGESNTPPDLIWLTFAWGSALMAGFLAYGISKDNFWVAIAGGTVIIFWSLAGVTAFVAIPLFVLMAVARILAKERIGL